MRGAIFDDLIDRLGPGFDCVAPDLPGHSAAVVPATLDASADVVAAQLARWPGRLPLLVGWSMGAAVAWRHIRRHGTGGLAGLVTVDMSPRMVPGPDWPHGLIGQSAESVAATTRRFATEWEKATHGIAATMFATSAGAPGCSREEARAVILSQDAEKMRALWDDLVAADARDTIARVDLPWLVCSGAKSRVYPASASDWIADTAPDARRHVFTQSGHSPHLEEPEEFARVLKDFATSLP